MAKSDETQGSEKLQILLKEYGLCQSNLQRHNAWAWQTGAIFIALSLAALWASTQIEGINTKLYSPVLAFISLSTILIWFFFIFNRARFYIDVTRQRIEEIEQQLKDQLPKDKNKFLLHSKIKEEDKRRKVTARYGVYLFIAFIVFAWIWILILNFFVLA